MFITLTKDPKTGIARVDTYKRRPSYTVIGLATVFLEVDVQKSRHADCDTQENVYDCITKIAKVLETTTHG